MPYVPPESGKEGFHCPHPECDTYARQDWFELLWRRGSGLQQVSGLKLAECHHCGKYSVWRGQKMIFPVIRTASPPHPDMPDSAAADYEEARAVFQESPRSSCALLRLAVQKLCIELGQPGRNLNEDIGALVQLGLPIQIQRSLDIVRVVGNNQVHPGVLDVRDDPDMANLLFALVNLIVEDRISRPKHVDALYGKLPEAARKQIEERDAKAKAGKSVIDG